MFCRLGMQLWQGLQGHGQINAFLNIMYTYIRNISAILISHLLERIFGLEVIKHSTLLMSLNRGMMRSDSILLQRRNVRRFAVITFR